MNLFGTWGINNKEIANFGKYAHRNFNSNLWYKTKGILNDIQLGRFPINNDGVEIITTELKTDGGVNSEEMLI